ncbi:MAG TPA: hypothetical protein VN317_04845 [Candidatus Methanoperedens sp.]|nr:hypothetical protein [Candidatus Methanoperedens sp.]
MPRHGTVLLLLALAALGALLAFLGETTDLLPGLLVLAGLSLAAIPCFRIWIRRVDPRFPLALFLAAFCLKMLGATARYWALTDLYHYAGDAVRYLDEGGAVARSLANLDFSFDLDAPAGTTGMIVLSGIVLTVFPADLLANYYLFSFLAFLGSIGYYRAFLLAFPGARCGLYRALVFFLPSILYWPSSLGKDAWVFFGSSFVAYGVATLARGRSLAGIMHLVAGLLLTSIVRPHVAALMTVALAAAFALTALGARVVVRPGPLLSLVAIAALGFFFVTGATQSLLGESLAETRLDELTDFYELRRGFVKGGSKVEMPVIYSLLGPPYALVTVLFRPFPFEAHNPQALISSLETVGWLGLMLVRRRFFLERLRSLRRNPLVGFAALYTVIMILAQTTTGNLGIIARQRVQFLPFLWMLF